MHGRYTRMITNSYGQQVYTVEECEAILALRHGKDRELITNTFVDELIELRKQGKWHKCEYQKGDLIGDDEE